MKQITKYMLSVALLFGATFLFFSCDNIDDMPRIKKNDNANSKTYKQPDPTVGTAKEKQEADSVAAEYERGIK